MKKLKYLAIFMFLASSASASWSTNAWPSTNNIRAFGTNNWTVVSNAAAQTVYSTFSVTSSLAIPSWSTNGYIYTSGDIDFWSYPSNPLFDYPPVFWVPGGSDKAYPVVGVASIGASVSNYLAVTNVFYSQIFADDPGVEGFDAPLGEGSLGDFGAGGITNTYEYVSGGVTQQITETWSYSFTNEIIEIGLGPKDMRVYDTYWALKEREEIGSGRWGIGASAIFLYRPVLHRWGKYALDTEGAEGVVHSGKAFIKDLMSNYNWLDLSYYGTNDNLDAYLASVGATGLNSNVELTISNMLTNVGAPTNYLEYTPLRQLDGVGYPYGRFVTNTWQMGVNSGTNTRSVTDYTGGVHSVTFTNDVPYTLVITNDNIQEGFSELDYGWRYMQEVIQQMGQGIVKGTWEEEGVPNIIRDKYWNLGTNTTWASAQLDATNAFNVGLPYASLRPIYGTRGEYTNALWPNAQPYAAYIYSIETIPTVNLIETNSGVPTRVHFYVRGDPFPDTGTFDNQGYSISNQLTTLWETSAYSTNLSTIEAINHVGTTNPLSVSWPADPAANVSNIVEKGFILDTDAAEWYRVLEWDFNYK
jgi:hypothetical protein